MLGTKTRTFLVNHPRVTSALFALMMLFSQFGTVIASGDGHSGP